MSLILFVILLAIIGLCVGFDRTTFPPRPGPIGMGGTILIGLTGSFMAGLFSWYIFKIHGAVLILSVVSTMLLLGIRRWSETGCR